MSERKEPEVVAWQSRANTAFVTTYKEDVSHWRSCNFEVSELITLADHREVVAEKDAEIQKLKDALKECVSAWGVESGYVYAMNAAIIKAQELL